MNCNHVLHCVAISESLHNREYQSDFLSSTTGLNAICKMKSMVKFVNAFSLVLSFRTYSGKDKNFHRVSKH